MNPRIAKIKEEIEKIKDKLNKGQNRLRELEKQLTDLENADIVAAVRGVDIEPDQLAAFVKMFRDKQNGGTVPDLDKSVPTATEPILSGGTAEKIQNDKEDSD